MADESCCTVFDEGGEAGGLSEPEESGAEAGGLSGLPEAGAVLLSPTVLSDEGVSGTGAGAVSLPEPELELDVSGDDAFAEPELEDSEDPAPLLEGETNGPAGDAGPDCPLRPVGGETLADELFEADGVGVGRTTGALLFVALVILRRGWSMVRQEPGYNERTQSTPKTFGMAAKESRQGTAM